MEEIAEHRGVWMLFLARYFDVWHRRDEVDIALLERCVLEFFTDILDGTKCTIAAHDFFDGRRQM
jgi:hypothetical protein